MKCDIQAIVLPCC